MDDAPRYTNLRDYLRVVRDQRAIVVLAVLLCAGAALGLSLRAQPVYQAEASLSFKDPNADLGDLGAAVPVTQTPEQRAAIGAQRVTELDVARRAADFYRPRTAPATLLGRVSAQPEAQTNLVIVQGSGSSGRAAAALANAFARATSELARDRDRARYTQIAASLRRANRHLPRNATTAFTRSANEDRLQRLASLAQLAEPVVVVNRAQAPATPASPKPVRNAILGLLAGLALGLMIAFVRDALDRRFRSGHEIRDELHLPLVGHVRDEVLGRSIVSPSHRLELSEVQLEAFRVLRTNLDFLDVDKQLKTIVVTSALPEEGKTTIAGALATAYATAGRRTLLVECDLRRPTIAQRWGVNAAPGLTDYLAGQAEPHEVVQTIALPAVRGGSSHINGNGTAPDPAPASASLVCITAGARYGQPAEMLASARFRTFLEETRKVYDVVIIDSSPLLSVSDTLELIPNVDGVVLCVRASKTTRDQARAAAAAIAHFPKRATGVVVTGVRAHDEGDYGYYSYSYAYGQDA